MKPTRKIATALTLLALGAGVAVTAHAGAQNAPQDDPFEKLKTYDFQSRGPVEAIRNLIDQSVTDKAATSQIEQKLDAVLDDPVATFAGKQEAARFLWVIGSGRSVPSLAKMLSDDKLADVARYALERNADPGAARALREAVGTTKDKTRIGVINSLGNRADADAVNVLKPLVTSTDATVSEAAIMALGKIGTPAAVSTLRALPPDNTQAGRAMIRAAERLASGGKKADAQKLYEGLAGESRPNVIRAGAVRGLAAMQSPRAAAVSLSALQSSDTYLQQVGAQVLGQLNNSAATTQAEAAWPTLPPAAQTVLLTAWADRNETSASSLALQATASADPAVRQAGLYASGRIGGVKAVPRLADVVVHGQGGDRNSAREALAGMSGADVDTAILQLAQNGQPDVRGAMLNILADRPTPITRAALLTAAKGGDSRAAVQSLRALSRVGGANEYPQLVTLAATTSNDDVRDAARDAVVSVSQRMGNSDQAANPVFAAYAGASPQGKSALLPVLANLGTDRALTELTNATKSGDAGIKQSAVTALAETWTDTRPLPALLNIASNDSDKSLRVQALRGYLRLVQQDERMGNTEKVNRVSQALQAAQRPEEKRQALNVLRDIRVSQAVELSAKYLDDPDVFSDAANTVIYLAGAQRRNNRDLPAVKGQATTAALTKVIETTKDDNQKAQAQSLR